MAKRECAIDIETFSSVDIDRGVYAYVEAEDFEIILVAYKFSDDDRVRQFMPAKFRDRPGVMTGAAEQIGMTGDGPLTFDGDEDAFLEALNDKTILKTAYNANFERTCLAQYYGVECDPDDWRCTAVLASVAGLPRSLKEVGDALDLSEDEKKLRTGKALINFFCKPISPGKSNGFRTRNLPRHDMARWRLFCEYNLQDVVTEQAIRQRLRAFQPNDTEQHLWSVDQRICDRGIRIDRPFVEGIVEHDAKRQAALKEEAREITGLDNPNSIIALKQWFSSHGAKELGGDLSKDAVSAALKKQYPANVTRMLQIRQALGKTSTTKYVAMLGSVCHDDRVKGMLQFYGANRTGRWCLTGDHEVLTQEGWRRLDEWQGGAIACWNSTSESVSFQTAKALSFPYKGVMYNYKDVRIDQCSTPDHKMWVQKRNNGEWQAMTVEEMARCGRPCIPFTGYRYHRGCANPAWLRVLIMTQADGHYDTDGAVKFHFKKERKIERCKHLLRKAEIAYVEKVYKEATTISVPARAVPLWLRQFRTKTFGFWLLDENPDIFFDELPHWDGYFPAPNSIQYCTCDRQNADIVQALAHMSGRAANMRIKKHNELNRKWKDAYVVDIWLTPRNCHEIKARPTTEYFDGTVYCAETKTGYFLVRRNGKVWVTGNSGRIVQLQNLPQNHIPDLDLARELVAEGDYEAVELLYGETGQVLSELVRTAFIPSEGSRFVVTDFSAIEARVIAWLAGEEWRLNAFRQGKDIYCESASQMFKVPVVKHGINGHLRQRGKIAELACIAEDQLVLTDYGLVPIQNVTTDMKVWDGKEWVKHEGVVYRGEKRVISFDGLTATPDHLIINQGECVPFGKYAGAKAIDTGIQRVYDIRNAGKNHRYEVSGYLVHNCGYGGGIGAMKAMDKEGRIPEEEIRGIIDQWREASPAIVKLWSDYEKAAITAIRKGSNIDPLRYVDGEKRKFKVKITRTSQDWGEVHQSVQYLTTYAVSPEQAANNARFRVEGKHAYWFEEYGNEYSCHWYHYQAFEEWQDPETCQKHETEADAKVILSKGIEFEYKEGNLLVRLPSGRKITYWGATLGKNRFGRLAVHYMGVNQTTHQWGKVETYGGKIVENCLGGETLVVTDHGIKPIVDVSISDHLWDGVAWVNHRGVVYKGEQNVIEVNGVRVTPDHKILTNKGWMRASQSEGFNGPAHESSNSDKLRGFRRKEVPLESPMRLRKDIHHACIGVYEGQDSILRLPKKKSYQSEETAPRIVGFTYMECVAFHERALPDTDSTSLEELRRSWDNSFSGLADLREFLPRYGGNIQAWPDFRPHRCQRTILQRKLSVGAHERAVPKQAKLTVYSNTERSNDRRRSFGNIRYRRDHIALSTQSRLADTFAISEARLPKQSVYDILNAGPNHRFTVLGNNGAMIVHNCVQSVARDCLAEKLMEAEARGYKVVAHVHDEMIIDVPRSNGDAMRDIDAMMAEPIAWAPGLPLKGGTYECDYYQKD